MGKGRREDAERDNDPMLCPVCSTSVMHHCDTCGQCKCKGGNACPNRRR